MNRTLLFVDTATRSKRLSSVRVGWTSPCSGPQRCDDSVDGDIGLLVQFSPASSLLDLLHLSDELERHLGRPVGVVSRNALRPRDGHVLAEAVRV